MYSAKGIVENMTVLL